MPIRQSFCYPLYRPPELPDAELFARVRAMGYQATEVWDRDQLDDYRKLFQTAREAGLAIASMSAHASLADGLNRSENHDRIEREIDASLEIAMDYRIPGMICFSGNRNPGQSDLAGLRACARILRRVAPRAEQAGINLNVELLNSRVDHPGYQCDHTEWGVALCEMVGSPRIRLLYDIYHMQIMEGDLIRTIRENIEYIGHFHTAGNPGRRDLDGEQELNYQGICRAINETGYDLYLGHEFRPKGDPLASLDAAFAACDVG